jgi:hypothetical protein
MAAVTDESGGVGVGRLVLLVTVVRTLSANVMTAGTRRGNLKK